MEETEPTEQTDADDSTQHGVSGEQVDESEEKKMTNGVEETSEETSDQNVSYQTSLPSSSQGCTNIPGRLTPGPFSSFGSLVGIKTKGQNYYKKLMKQHKSTIFRMHLFQPRIMVCDHQALESLFVPENVRKVAQFGSMIVNQNIMRGNTPLMFNNPPEYEKKRDFFNQNMKVLKCDSRTILEVVKKEFQQMIDTGRMTTDFEDSIGEMVCKIASRLVLGSSYLEYSQVKVWFDQLLVPVFKENKFNDSLGVKACDVLAQQIVESPKGSELIKEAEKCGMDGSVVAMELLYMTIFNMWGSIYPLIVSGFIYSSTSLTEEQLTTLQREADQVLRGSAPNAPTPLLDSFVMEVLRLHPPAHTIYGVATQPFTMESQSGTFSVQKDELVCGSIYWVQRNDNLFENPNAFQVDRFSKNPDLIQFLYAFASPDEGNHFHKCLGKHLALEVLKIAYSKVVYCSVVPHRVPYWSGNLLMRLPASDKPFTVKNFHDTLGRREEEKWNGYSQHLL